ncbi:MAG: isoprenyl transferase [Elusimicrobia bacterium]|nr:isoprenyl transferase [Elusimicrobiota bacterium]
MPPLQEQKSGVLSEEPSLDPQRLPRHIAVIMDGNGRWAQERHLPRLAGHRAGVESVREAVRTCARLGIPVLTLYAFSTENWKRPPEEIQELMRLLGYVLDREVEELHANGVRLKTIGRIAELPEFVQTKLRAAAERLKDNSALLLNLALNYGGRQEILDAVCAARDAGLETLDEAALSRHLYTAGLPDPDLLIRTSGEMRLSNFLLWQIAYAELYVTPVHWPDFRRKDLLEAIAQYQRRCRRFGGV